MTPDRRALELVAAAGHGGAIIVHLLGYVWHRAISGRSDGWAVFHAGLAMVSLGSLVVHIRRALRRSAGQPLHPAVLR